VSEIKKHLLNQIESSNDFFWLKTRHNLVGKKVKKYSINDVVDIGAGVGGLGDELKNHSKANYYFIEIDDKSQELLEQKFGKEHNLLYSSKEFNKTTGITFLDVIEHVENPYKFINDYLTKFNNTYVIITVPSYQILWSNWDILLGHYRRYTKKSLIELTKSLGIKKIEASYIFPELLPAAFIRKILNSNKVNFPKLPKVLNNILFLFSLFIQKIRFLFPFGLSIFYVGYYDSE